MLGEALVTRSLLRKPSTSSTRVTIPLNSILKASPKVEDNRDMKKCNTHKETQSYKNNPEQETSDWDGSFSAMDIDSSKSLAPVSFKDALISKVDKDRNGGFDEFDKVELEDEDVVISSNGSFLVTTFFDRV